MKFWIRRRRKATETAVAVEEAKEERDALLMEVGEAIKKVDKFQNELIKEYEQANGVRFERHA